MGKPESMATKEFQNFQWFSGNEASDSEEVEAQKHEVITNLSEAAKLRLEAIEDLIAPRDHATYGQKLRKWSEIFTKLVRTVQRLIKNWEKRGLLAITDDARETRNSPALARSCRVTLYLSS